MLTLCVKLCSTVHEPDVTVSDTCFTARPAVSRNTHAGEHCDLGRGTTSAMLTRMAQTLVDV